MTMKKGAEKNMKVKSTSRINVYAQPDQANAKVGVEAEYIHVKQLKAALDTFSDTDLCYAYEGEVCGIIILSPQRKELGYIENNGNIHRNK